MHGSLLTATQGTAAHAAAIFVLVLALALLVPLAVVLLILLLLLLLLLLLFPSPLAPCSHHILQKYEDSTPGYDGHHPKFSCP